MRLLEWQAKQLFAEHNIPIPASVLAASVDELDGVAYPAVMKAQVPIGGRGKAGAVRLVKSLSEAREELERLFNLDVKGYIPRSVLLEQPVEIQREVYLSLLYDRVTNQPMIIASPMGGVDIEQVARETPEQIIKLPVDLFLGLKGFMVRYLSKHLGLSGNMDLETVLRGMMAILVQHDARLIEINPLAETENGLLALDAKLELDDKASDRQAALFERLRGEQTYILKKEATPAERMAQEYGVKYVTLDGNVGIITDGAGTGMLTLDLVSDEGGRPANFCELGGFASPDMAYNAIQVVLANPNVKVLLITLIGGLTRMDEMAEGIARYLRENQQKAPLVVRMCGTKEEEGIELLRQVGQDIHNDINAAVKEAVRMAASEASWQS
jgi:succinyl-CoA synthetase beta subunit